MRTYTHGLVGYLIYIKGTPEQRKLAVIGAMIPDLLVGIGFIFHYTGEAAWSDFLHYVFHRSPLHGVTEALHSFVLIVPLLLGCMIFKKSWTPFFVGMASHAVLDLLTHQQSAYNHFYPFDITPFISPISYTNLPFTIIEHLIFVSLVAYLIWNYYRQKKN
ncbi:hypothetical protein GW756_04535 [bacterium]|nr:hypothetical protein [bacterium]NCQ55132.1 hypothetical protein [Candidatus Parcubacteria bacterium]NCS67355.1 hypothetical protein [Candidatus Peregrinibacteria bacterium]NCS96610.1 hypothetical protein [bacterium]